MPKAARKKDDHKCPQQTGRVPHVGGPIQEGDRDVLIGDEEAARVGDKALCRGPIDTIAKGSRTVLISNRQAARVGDATRHLGSITKGCRTVLIGSSAEADALKAAALIGAPFCEAGGPLARAAEGK